MLVAFLLVNVLQISLCQFYFGAVPSGNSLFPEVTLKAYKPRGLEISIRKSPDIVQLVKFEYSKNNEALHTANIENSLMGVWYLFDPKIQLKIGDFVRYKITILSNRFDPSRAVTGPGNVKFGISFGAPQHSYTDTQIWNVTALDTLCESQQSTNANCNADGIIFEDDFLDERNRDLWTIEQYIPQYSEENYEFVSYQDVEECVFLSDSKLYLKPTVVPTSQLQGTLDLRQKCTRNTTQACLHKQIGANYLPPIKSGRIVSNFSFKYGKVEVTAKLPIGDWIFPQIELIPADLTKKYPKFLIAYSRGNKRLATKEGREIGSNILFGGYVTSTEEMKQTDSLKSIKLLSNLREDMNVFTLTWTPDKIVLGVNGDIYSTTYQSVNDGNYRVALGVGVGGNVDFPDDSISGTHTKPWINEAAKQVKDFIDAKSSWINSWSGDDVALQVDYVKVFEV